MATSLQRSTVESGGDGWPGANFTADRLSCLWTIRIFSGPPSKPLVGILGDVDGRIVPVAPPPIAQLLGKVTIASAEKQSTNRHPE
jgi:hypothetical protein